MRISSQKNKTTCVHRCVSGGSGRQFSFHLDFNTWDHGRFDRAGRMFNVKSISKATWLLILVERHQRYISWVFRYETPVRFSSHSQSVPRATFSSATWLYIELQWLHQLVRVFIGLSRLQPGRGTLMRLWEHQPQRTSCDCNSPDGRDKSGATVLTWWVQWAGTCRRRCSWPTARTAAVKRSASQ